MKNNACDLVCLGMLYACSFFFLVLWSMVVLLEVLMICYVGFISKLMWFYYEAECMDYACMVILWILHFS